MPSRIKDRGKNWRVREGANFIAVEHLYSGRRTALNPGDSYSIVLPPEGAEAMAEEILAAVRKIRTENAWRDYHSESLATDNEDTDKDPWECPNCYAENEFGNNTCWKCGKLQ